MACPLKTAGPLDGDDDEEMVNMYIVHEGETEPEDQVGLLESLEVLWRKS